MSESIFTPHEKRVIEILGHAWDEFLSLPTIHPSDRQEFMAAVHAAQNIVIARPGLRELQGNLDPYLWLKRPPESEVNSQLASDSPAA